MLMSSDIEIIKQLESEIGGEIEIRRDISSNWSFFKRRAAFLKSLDKSPSLLTGIRKIDRISPRTRLAVINSDGRVIRLYLNKVSLKRTWKPRPLGGEETFSRPRRPVTVVIACAHVSLRNKPYGL